MGKTIMRLESARLSDAVGRPAAFGAILSGTPKETSVPLYDDKRKNFACGVWECTSGVVDMRNWPYDEFCVLLSGRVIITPEGGEPQEIRQGDALVIPLGFTGTWDIKEPVRKFYSIQRPSLWLRAARRAKRELTTLTRKLPGRGSQPAIPVRETGL